MRADKSPVLTWVDFGLTHPQKGVIAMASEMLLINPRKRRRAASTKRKAVRRRARRSPMALAAPRRVRRRVARRRNPIGAYHRRRRVSRRRNPIMARRRRRNPISMGSGGGSIVSMLKAAVVGGGGAIAMDLAMGQIAKFLPASMAKVPGKVGVYEAVKFGATVVLGKMLSKPTRGLSQRMAAGSLTVQAYTMLQTMLPSTMTLGGMGYYSPAAIANVNNRIGPNQMSRYAAPGNTPLLSRYGTPGGPSPLLSAREREGVRFR